MNGRVEDYDRICMPIGWGRHPRFEALVRRCGYEGLGIFLVLQDYVAEHGSDDMEMVLPESGFGSIVDIAEALRCEKQKLRDVIEVSSFLELIERDAGMIAFRKASKFRRGSQKLTNVNVQDRSNVNVNVSYVKPSGLTEASNPGRPDVEVPASGKANVSNVDGYDCTLEALTDDLGLGDSPWTRLAKEASDAGKGLVTFNKSLREKLQSLIVAFGDIEVHGAWRCYIHEIRTRTPLTAYPPTDKIAIFVSQKCFGEKRNDFKKISGSYVEEPFERVPLSRSDELLPDSEPRKVSGGEAYPQPKYRTDDIERRTGLVPESQALSSVGYKPTEERASPATAPGWFDDPNKPFAQYVIEARQAEKLAEDEQWELIMQTMDETVGQKMDWLGTGRR